MSQDGPKCPLDITPGMVAGLLEVVGLFKGRVDLAQLSKEVGMELGHLLRVVETAEALGLISVVDGDVQITQSGLGFSRKLSTGKIKILSELVERVEPFRSIIQFVASRNEPVTVEEINAAVKLCEHDEEQLERLRTFIIDWLVMTGWLEYDGEARAFKLKRKRPAKSAIPSSQG